MASRLVRRIVDDGDVSFSYVRHGFASGHVDQRAKHVRIGVEAGEASRTGRPHDPHHNGLDLIIPRVRCDNWCPRFSPDTPEKRPARASPFGLSGAGRTSVTDDDAEATRHHLLGHMRGRCLGRIPRPMVERRHGRDPRRGEVRRRVE
jgi:hypothetical protein